MSANVTAKLI